ncbi:HPF/RaiA family ribosome-associated protein [Xylophilus sp. ASV27]|uniref:HPF/RaiA family ribosome-associated protein n=1 Tax=Xylophilus sp. ASV27 TaxID=2795129 RepID=UPI0018EB9B49|nr:HPF/RaiA family ribosome-associated protein [Xylophilus sp. ASV27]
MQVQVRASSGIEIREATERWASEELNEGLARFRAEITRIEVYLSEERKSAAGTEDTRCAMEARLARHPAVTVSHHAGGVDESFRGALRKLRHALESVLDREADHRDRQSIRHDLDPVAD